MTEQLDRGAEQGLQYQRLASPKQADSGPNLLLGVVGGLLAALAGGIIWGLVVIESGYELGFAAWGIGALAGFAVVYLARGSNAQLQIVAVLAAVLGILIGKYITFVHAIRLAFTKLNPGFPQVYGYLDSESFRLFRQHPRVVFHAFDLIWVVLAIASAWRIAERTKQRATIATSANTAPAAPISGGPTAAPPVDPALYNAPPAPPQSDPARIPPENNPPASPTI